MCWPGNKKVGPKLTKATSLGFLPNNGYMTRCRNTGILSKRFPVSIETGELIADDGFIEWV